MFLETKRIEECSSFTNNFLFFINFFQNVESLRSKNDSERSISNLIPTR